MLTLGRNRFDTNPLFQSKKRRLFKTNSEDSAFFKTSLKVNDSEKSKLHVTVSPTKAAYLSQEQHGLATTAMTRTASFGASSQASQESALSPKVRMQMKRILMLANSKKPSTSNSLKFYLGLRPHEQIADKGFDITDSQSRRKRSQVDSALAEETTLESDIDF